MHLQYLILPLLAVASLTVTTQAARIKLVGEPGEVGSKVIGDKVHPYSIPPTILFSFAG